jgi:hypothetical protein
MNESKDILKEVKIDFFFLIQYFFVKLTNILIIIVLFTV